MTLPFLEWILLKRLDEQTGLYILLQFSEEKYVKFDSMHPKSESVFLIK